MYVFLVNKQPKSVNARYTDKYKQEIKKTFLSDYGAITPLSDTLYGICYYFHNKPSTMDADNLSKPIWDALEEIVYTDDKIIKLRISGMIDLKKHHESTTIDFTYLPVKIFARFIDMMDTEDHILYIELGVLDYKKHFRMNIE